MIETAVTLPVLLRGHGTKLQSYKRGDKVTNSSEQSPAFDDGGVITEIVIQEMTQKWEHLEVVFLASYPAKSDLKPET